MLKVGDFKEKLNYSQDQIIPIFEAAGQKKIANQLDQCGNFVRVATCHHCGEKHFGGTNHCRSRYCPVCAKLRSLLWLAKLLPYFNAWLKKGNYIFMMNFTIKDTKTLKEGIDLLKKGWRELTNEKWNRREWKRRFAGGVRSLEVKTGENSGLWHPHFHCLVLKDHFEKDFDYLKTSWERALRNAADSGEKLGSVWVKGFSKQDAGSEGLIHSILEVFKYMTKLDEMNTAPEKVNEMVRTLYGKRAVQAWGILYGLSTEVEEDFLKYDYSELKDYVCSRCGMSKFDFDVIIRGSFMVEKDIKDLVKKKGDKT